MKNKLKNKQLSFNMEDFDSVSLVNEDMKKLTGGQATT